MKTLLMLTATLAPPIAIAQQSDPPISAGVTVQPDPQTEAAVLAKFSGKTRTKLEAILVTAKGKNLPSKPLVDRMSGGKASGVADADIVGATNLLMGRLETSQRTLVQAGRRSPDAREVAFGAAILERAATPAQLEAVIRTAPANRSLVVALEVLTKLSDRGLMIDNALAQVSSKLAAGAGDSEITSLLSTLGLK